MQKLKHYTWTNDNDDEMTLVDRIKDISTVNNIITVIPSVYIEIEGVRVLAHAIILYEYV